MQALKVPHSEARCLLEKARIKKIKVPVFASGEDNTVTSGKNNPGNILGLVLFFVLVFLYLNLRPKVC